MPKVESPGVLGARKLQLNGNPARGVRDVIAGTATNGNLSDVSTK